MNSDATEAALGLLGLSPLNNPPSLTSNNVGITVELPPSLVPLKRKQPSPATLHFPPRQSLPTVLTKALAAPQRPFSPILSGPVPPHSLASPSTSQHPLALSNVPPPPDADAIACICGFTYDDGFSIACDDCSRWCHAACFGIVQGGEVPEFWKCWVCDPALVVDKERAVKVQKGRLKTMRTKASHAANGVPGTPSMNGIGANSVVDEGSGGIGKPTSRRKTSPGAERKSRRGSAVAAAIEGSTSSRKKRRASMLSPANPSIPSANHPSAHPHTGSSRTFHLNGNSPSLPPTTPIEFPPDTYPNPTVYTQLLRVAKAWRGVTALNPPSPLIRPPPKAYTDRGYTMVDSQGYRDHYGYSMSPLDNTTPVVMDENAGGAYVPRTVLRTDPVVSPSSPHLSLNSQYPPTCSPTHLRPPSPRLHVASDPSHTSIYPSPPISQHMPTPMPGSSQPCPSVKSPLTPTANTTSSHNPNDTIPATTLLAPYTASVVPSAAYLADPLNGYAHLGMGKPQVRLVGGGWEVGLDARGVGGIPEPGVKGNGSKEDLANGKAKWARCGCWPNVVVRPVICSGKRGEKGLRHRAECANAGSYGSTVSEAGGSSPTVNGTSVPPTTSQTQGQQIDNLSDRDDTPSTSDSDADPTTLSFALFALRDLRADEEIVLGWEWDDGHAVHTLPALMESPGLFAPAHLHHLRAQFTSILHALSSTFTTCACGSSTRDCAVRLMERVVEGRWPWPSGEVASEGSEGDASDAHGGSEEWEDGDVDVEGDGDADPHASWNWGLGMNVDVDIEMDTSNGVEMRNRRVKKRKVRKKIRVEDSTQVNGGQDVNRVASSSPPKQKTKKAIDLGPLVGVKRGFRTREKEPMNGGWGGVEIVPSSLKAFPDVQEEDPHEGDKGKGEAQVVDDKKGTDVGPWPAVLPPRMRKTWVRPSPGQPEPRQGDHHPHDHTLRIENERKQEQWSPICTEGTSSGSKDDVRKQGSSIVNDDGEEGVDGQETEFDTETETDGLDDTRQMPPPPMPASLDPTTVSSLAHAIAVRSASPRGSVHWEKNSTSTTWAPPQTSTSASALPSRLGQPPGQSTFSVTPAPPITRSPLAPQVNHDAPSPSTSLPVAVQGHPQSHLSPLVPSVSPSTTFSKLSLHSPDASSLSHLAVLCGPEESTLLPASIQPASPAYRPSKPLHVHPLNEPPLPPSLTTSMVAHSSLDSTRDTPAEAQYQQPYRPSPESLQETEPLSDAEKGRSGNGETYRVRFASPEILSGVPQLKGRTTSDSSGTIGAYDGVSTNADAIGAMKQQDDSPPDRDTMVVNLDVDGDNQEDCSGTLHTTSPESRVDHTSEDEYPSQYAQSLAPPAPSPHNTITVDDEAMLENDPSPTASNANRVTPQAEPMAVDPTPAQPAREPSPPPPPKVKMSLKDFALRKKKQREEEMAAKALGSPATSDDPVLPPSPSVDVKQDLAGEHTGVVQSTGSAEIVNAQDVKMHDGTNGDALLSSGALHVDTIGLEGESEHRHGRNSGCDPRRAEEKIMAGDIKLSTEPQAPPMIATESPDTLQSSRQQSVLPSTTPSRVLGETNSKHQTQAQIDGNPTTLAAKIEVMDAMVPSGLVGVDDPPPDVVSFAPEPPPPPLTTEQTVEGTTTDHSILGSSIPRSTPASSSTPTSMSTSTSTSGVNSRSNSVGISCSTPNLNSLPYAYVPSPPSNIPSSRRPSQEDGEITSSTPPKAYLPRSHTPPTQPRSFHAAHSPSPNLGPTSTSIAPVPRRSAPPLSRSPLSNNTGPSLTSISSRPLPSGPRALRGSMTQPTHPYAPPPRPYTGSQYIPRGPSADRDRMDWERGDRQWVVQARSRGRAGSSGWGR